jgi:hypothetical protein
MEDLTLYTKYDPQGKITVSGTSVSWSSLQSTPYSLYKDFGSAVFDGNFSIDFECRLDSTGGVWDPNLIMTFSNNGGLSSYSNLSTGDIFLNMRSYGTPQIRFGEHNKSEVGVNISLSTLYYCRLVRDESFGTYGKLTLSLYSDLARTTLVTSADYTLTSKLDFRYLYVILSENAGSQYVQSGLVKNIDLGMQPSFNPHFSRRKLL